jgi:tRNA/tmRNA/rRNA uracil-C5-methylase (TrmA/RlmC/RlmD family)
MNEAAIADAQINAEINGIKNCKFVCGKVFTHIQFLYAFDSSYT